MLHRLQYEQNRAFARGGRAGPAPSQNGFSLSLPRSESGRDFDLPRHSHYSGVISMVFQHSASGPGWLRRCRPARPGPRGGGLHARSVGPPPRAFSLVSGLRCCLLGRVRAAAYAAADSTHAPSGRRTADRRRADEGRHGRRARAGTPRGLSARYRAPLLALAGLGGASAPSFRLVAAGRGPRPPTATPPCSL